LFVGLLMYLVVRSALQALHSQGNIPSSHWMGGWAHSTDCLDKLEKWKTPVLCPKKKHISWDKQIAARTV